MSGDDEETSEEEAREKLFERMRQTMIHGDCHVRPTVDGEPVPTVKEAHEIADRQRRKHLTFGYRYADQIMADEDWDGAVESMRETLEALEETVEEHDGPPLDADSDWRDASNAVAQGARADLIYHEMRQRLITGSIVPESILFDDEKEAEMASKGEDPAIIVDGREIPIEKFGIDDPERARDLFAQDPNVDVMVATEHPSESVEPSDKQREMADKMAEAHGREISDDPEIFELVEAVDDEPEPDPDPDPDVRQILDDRYGDHEVETRSQSTRDCVYIVEVGVLRYVFTETGGERFTARVEHGNGHDYAPGPYDGIIEACDGIEMFVDKLLAETKDANE